MEEEPIKEQPPSAGNSNSARPVLPKYALRSFSKFKDNKPDAPDRSFSSLSKRGMRTPSVCRSVGVLDFSGKEKSASAKPPRRLSIPAKASATPKQKPVGNITPISETRRMRSGDGQGPLSRSQTPVSDISRTSSRMKFNLLSSCSYWLNQIKLSEAAAKHSVSLGFFKLALEARCEPFQKMQNELKSYVNRHQLAELGEPVKELLESYNIGENVEQSQVSESSNIAENIEQSQVSESSNIVENIEQNQVSESISQMPEEGTRSSDDEVHCCSSSAIDTANLKPKCLNNDSTQLTPVITIESTKKETSQKSNTGAGLRESLRKNSTNSRSASDSGKLRSVKKSEKPTKQQTAEKEKGKVKKQGKKSDVIKVPISPTQTEYNVQGNKENVDVETPDVMSLTEEVA
ncbi:hypothetical protein RJT34_33400 [Clitoria ternatea]|uniref:Uncharacterized protein n=1 Tax=Clitoria ternatea TaxID=43366 RepID=A0AAN9I4L0_CLITE